MKATKVLGIVLGTLLVAGLFVGAAAAGDTSLGDVYVYKLYDNTTGLKPLVIADNATWTKGTESITFIAEPGTNGGKFFISGDNVVEGTYKRVVGDKTYTIDVKYPTAQVVGFIYNESNTAIDTLIGNAVSVKMNVSFQPIADADGLMFTNPDGYSFTTFADADYKNLTKPTSPVKLTGVDLGVWTVQALYTKGNSAFSNLSPVEMLGVPYTFTVVKDDTSYNLEVVEEEILEGGYATIVATVPASKIYKVEVSNGKFVDGQTVIDILSPKTTANLTVGTSGVEKFLVQSTSSDNIKVKIYAHDDRSLVKKEISVKVLSGDVTAEIDGSDAVYIGNAVDLEGTNDFGGEVVFFIDGKNFPIKHYAGDTGNGKEWTATIETIDLKKADGKRVDAGTYNIYAAVLADGKTVKNVTDVKDLSDDKIVKAYATISLLLKEPFITLTSTEKVAIQGEELSIKGLAEGNPKDVQYYVFGQNYFRNGTATVDSDNAFSVKLNKTMTNEMATGQYFIVIQHKMYDNMYNIAPVGQNIVVNESADVLTTQKGTFLFNTTEKQSENGAKALCDELDAQKIDDMYIKLSINVIEPTSTIDAIPEKITKPQVLTVSGKSQGHKGDIVAVKINLGGNFDPKTKQESSAGSMATSAAKNVKIGDDGVWSVSFDTAELVAGDYVCSVAVGTESDKTMPFTLVEGAGPQPTQTTTPVTPTAQPTAQPTQTPATPGFGALAALAGLGAVAVLLLRRQ